MQCQNCNERPAAIHLTQIVNNSVTTLHLCDVCAEAKGIQTGVTAAKFPLSDFLASMGKGAASQLPVTDEKARCTSCDGTLDDFRESGRLGCPGCYDTFYRHLRDLLRRLHGSSQHIGDAYERDVPSREETPSRSTEEELRDQLREAIQAERFELAAELRDRIKRLESHAGS